MFCAEGILIRSLLIEAIRTEERGNFWAKYGVLTILQRWLVVLGLLGAFKQAGYALYLPIGFPVLPGAGVTCKPSMPR